MLLERPVYEALPQIEAVLHYSASIAEKPYTYTYEPPAGVPPQNVNYDPQLVVIRNGRSATGTFDLDYEGFALERHRSAVRDFYDEEAVRRRYYPEAEAVLKAVTGATRAIVFDHNIRDRARLGQSGAKEPVKRVHVDFTTRSGFTRAQMVLEAQGVENSDLLLKGRFAVVNLWRPIAPVEESPLAVCGADSIAPADLVASDLIYRDRVGETYLVSYNPAHRWFYFPLMQPDEVLLIKCFDSSEQGPARFAAHTAFDDPTSVAQARPRASIELRSLVFYPD